MLLVGKIIIDMILHHYTRPINTSALVNVQAIDAAQVVCDYNAGFPVRADLHDFAVQGSGTIQMSGSEIQINGQAFALGNTMTYPVDMALEKWYMWASFRAVTVASAGAVVALGTLGTQVRAAAGTNKCVAVNVDLGNSATRGRIQILTGNVSAGFTTRATSASITIANNDVIKLELTRNGNTFDAALTNVTAGTSITLQYVFTISSTADPVLPIIARPCIFRYLTATINMLGFGFTDLTARQPQLLIIGDSKTAGYNATNYSNRWVGRLQAAYNGVEAISDFGGETVDALKHIYWLQRIRPATVLYAYGSNDSRNGYSNQGTIENILAFKKECGLLNIPFYFLAMAETGTNNQAAIIQRVKLFCPDTTIISYPTLAADNVHLNNDASHLTVYNDVVAALGSRLS